MISETIILDNRDQNILQRQIVDALGHQEYGADVNYINESVIDITVNHGGLYASINIERNVYKPEIVVVTVRDFQHRKRKRRDNVSLGDVKAIRNFALLRIFGFLAGFGFLFVLFTFPQYLIPYTTIMIMLFLYIMIFNIRKLRKKPTKVSSLNYKDILDTLRNYLVGQSTTHAST